MSHYTQIATKIRDADALATALRDLFPGVAVETSAGLTARGYQGQTAIVDVVAREAGGLSTDIGYRRAPDGTFVAVVDLYGSHGATVAETLRRLPQRTAYHALRRAAQAAGLALSYDSSQTADATARRF